MKLTAIRKLGAKKRQSQDQDNDGQQPVIIHKKFRKVEAKQAKSGTTLEQFTDIVLASEGMAVGEKESKSNHNNNNNVDYDQHQAMVANILNNKDLTVEVKPVKIKPVVLSPRYPNGYNCYRHHPKYKHYEEERSNRLTQQVVAVKPRKSRCDSSNSATSSEEHQSPPPPPPLPPNRPPNKSKMVIEWIKKMHDEDEEVMLLMKGQPMPRKHQLTLRDPVPVRNSDQVLNLSTKTCSETGSTSSPLNNNSVKQRDHGEVVILDRQPRQGCLSPPRLEITKILHHSSFSGKIVPRSFSTSHTRDSLKARGIRDIQLAHTKDMHGNL